jgi:glycosyltransferase involved in cell wall biosynthesis
MTTTAAPSALRVACVRASSSVGIARYCDRLSRALGELGLDYTTHERPEDGRWTHFHLGNSSRRPALQALRDSRYVTTLHDVRPRTRALNPLYRALVYPFPVERASATVVHSRYAADLVLGLGVRPRRLEVIPHPAATPVCADRQEARRALGLPEHALVAVLPGVIKRAKLVREAVAGVALAAADVPWLLVLAGQLRDRRAAREARAAGAVVLAQPDDRAYEHAIVAADVVLCLRNGSVGETNGPLLDALGARRAVLATATGSIPETAGDAARYIDCSARAVAAGLLELANVDEREERERFAAERAASLTWQASALAHADVFHEVFRG